MPAPLRILIAEDSLVFQTVLCELISGQRDMEVVRVVGDGEQALRSCEELSPDLVLMDIQMPKLDGLAATERIMASCPTPILVITSDPWHGGVDQSFRALSAGALDLVAKPEQLPWPSESLSAFLRKVRLLSQIPVIRHVRGRERHLQTLRSPSSPALDNPAILGIVASTGGPRSVARLLSELPAGFPSPILLVQHIIPGFSAHLASWLHTNTPLDVREARNGDQPESGTVYVAPTDQHLELDSDGRIALTNHAPLHGHRPSGDILLESMARVAPSRSVGVILSGMGSDGTMGLAALYRAGGATVVQGKRSSVVYSMPQSALDLGVVQRTVEIEDMARALLEVIESIHHRTT